MNQECEKRLRELAQSMIVGADISAVMHEVDMLRHNQKAANRMIHNLTVKGFRAMYAGVEWVARSYKTELSPLGVSVANLLGRVFMGIYHLSPAALERVDWKNNL